jgi:hypothetical protein
MASWMIIIPLHLSWLRVSSRMEMILASDNQGITDDGNLIFHYKSSFEIDSNITHLYS